MSAITVRAGKQSEEVGHDPQQVYIVGYNFCLVTKDFIEHTDHATLILVHGIDVRVLCVA